MANKSKRVGFAITTTQYEQWKEEAEKKGMTLSAFVRHATDVYVSFLKKSKKS